MTVLPLWRRGRRDAVRAPRSADLAREAIVFSGGGSLGAAQVGALQALYEAGITPDVVVGCSVGALNAAYLAVDPSAERVRDLEQLWRRMDQADVFPGGRFSVARRLAGRADRDRRSQPVDERLPAGVAAVRGEDGREHRDPEDAAEFAQRVGRTRRDPLFAAVDGAEHHRRDRGEEHRHTDAADDELGLAGPMGAEAALLRARR